MSIRIHRDPGIRPWRYRFPSLSEAIRWSGQPCRPWGFALWMLLALGLLPPASPARGAESEEAYGALRSNRCAEAGALFGRILASDPSNMGARYGRGLSRLCLGEYDTASEDLQAAAKAWPDRPEIALELGAALTSAGSYREARPWLETARRRQDLDAPASLLLGLGDLRLGELDRALQSFERAQGYAPIAAQAHYYAGVAEFRAERLSRAQGHFHSVVETAPGGPLAREARTFLVAIEARRRERYRVFGSLGFEYDSNVVLAPVQDLGSPGQQADGRFVLRTGSVVTPLRSQKVRLDLGYSFFQSLHFELGDFNLQSHEAFVDTAAVVPWGRIGVSSRFQYYLRKADLHRFLGQWSTRPFTVVRLGPGWEAEIHYRYRGRDFVETPFNDLGLDGAAHATGLRHQWALPAAGQLQIGYQFEREDLRDLSDATGKEENQFTNEAHAALAQISWPLPYDLDFSASYTFTDREFASTSQLPGGPPREDENHTVALTFRYPLPAGIELIAGYLGIVNDSNQSLYEYRRHVGIVAASVSY